MFAVLLHCVFLKVRVIKKKLWTGTIRSHFNKDPFVQLNTALPWSLLTQVFESSSEFTL